MVHVAVIPIIQRNGAVLLHRRQNTGYMDGYWDFAGTGHVEEGESPIYALIRECHEELGILILPHHTQVKHVAYLTQEAYSYIYIEVSAYHGQPQIKEPDKCSELKWFSWADLPDDLLSVHQKVLEQIEQGCSYSEY